MYRVMYKDAYQYVADRDGTFYYVRRVPHDVRQHYASSRISFSLRTKSHQSALRAAKSVTQRLEDYRLGLRLQQMDIPAIHLVKTDDMEDTSPLMMDAVEMYLSIKGKDDRTFIRTAHRNGEYVSKLLGNRPITSYSSAEAAQFREWCFQQGMNINTVKRVFASVRSIINLMFAGRWQGVPRRVFAPHRWPGQSAPKRVSTPIRTLPFAIIWAPPLMGYQYRKFCRSARGSPESVRKMIDGCRGLI